MYYLQAMNSKMGFAILQDNKRSYLFASPYKEIIAISKEESKNILKSQDWFVYRYRNSFKRLHVAREFMVNEFMARFIMKLMDVERAVNKGKLLSCSVDEKIDKVIDYLGKAAMQPSRATDVIMVIGGSQHLFELNAKQNKKIEAIKKALLLVNKDYEFLPHPFSPKESFGSDSFMAFLTVHMDKQKRFQSISNILMYFVHNEGMVSFSSDLKKEYEKYREKNADKKGFMTHFSFKNKEKSIKK
jgi:hypothetical protein